VTPVGNDEASQLGRLTPSVAFSYSFNNGQSPINESLDMSNADLVTDEGSTILVGEFPDGSALLCSALEVNNFLCLRFYSGSDVAMSVFELIGNNGSGAFEFCSTDLEFDVCVDSFFSSPDGTVSVTTGAQNASASLDSDQIRAQDGAYMSYMKQGETGEPNGLADNLNRHAVNKAIANIMNNK